MQVNRINPALYNNFYTTNTAKNNENSQINHLVSQIGKNVTLPNYQCNHPKFNFPLVNEIVKHKEKAIPSVLNLLSRTNDEKTVAEGLYVIDRMIESKTKGLDKAYPVISRFNGSSSPNIQVMLSGIYRKTQPPDAFGPLCKMLIRDSLKPNNPIFDPSEEIGGAILDYLRNQSAKNLYPNTFKTN